MSVLRHALWFIVLLALAPTCRAFTPITRARHLTYSGISIQRHNRARRDGTQQRALSDNIEPGFVEPDYLITDCIEIQNRPSFLETAMRPSILLRFALLVVGTGISLSNVAGSYNDFYLSLEAVAIPLGLLTAAADYIASIPPYAAPVDTVSPNVRCGTADDAVIHLYSSGYTASATWLALRVGPFCPQWLSALDPILGLLSAGIFIFSLFAPILTLLHHAGVVDAEEPLRHMVSIARLGQTPQDEPLPPLTKTELLRAKSLIAVGVVGCLFAPIAIKFAIADSEWWFRVLQEFPAQGTLESSTALFGVFATQASMVAHSIAKAGVAPFRIVAPAFAVVCFVLAIVPCACSLYWLGNNISFFSQYTL